MALLDDANLDPRDEGAWSWWQARRLEYNLTLVIAGWLAYAAAVTLNYAFGHPVWRNWQGGLGVTLFLGTAYLLILGLANILYLLGPAIEGRVAPSSVGSYRRTAYAMGRWGSLLVPLSFPLMQSALLIGAR